MSSIDFHTRYRSATAVPLLRIKHMLTLRHLLCYSRISAAFGDPHAVSTLMSPPSTAIY